MATLVDGDVWVCVDCYFGYHYGFRQVDDAWYSGDSDSPCDREPLTLLAAFDLADNTDANSETDTGIDDFSWSRCQGCGSTLGGSRYRLATFQKEG